MKIAHVITRMIIGGAQENTLFSVIGQSQNGHDVTLITGLSLGPEGSLDTVLKKNEYHFKTIVLTCMTRNLSLIADIQSLIKLWKLFRIERYDIVHTHSSKAGILGRLAAKLAGIKLIIHTIHGLPFHPYQSRWSFWFYVWCERLAARCCHKIVCVATAMKNQALRAKVGRSDQFIIIPSGVDLDRFCFDPAARQKYRQKFGLGETHIVIGTIARLFELKGHEYVIEAAEKLVPQYPHVRFIFIGDGILQEALKKNIRDRLLSDYFIFTGLIRPDEIGQIYSMLDIVVHASLREGLARVIPESMACERPIISFDVDGASDIIENEANGFLIPPQNTEQLICVLKRLITDLQLRNKIGRAGKSTVYPTFLYTYMIEQLEQLYKGKLG